VISTKAGYDMWPGPYGNWGSRKYLVASLDESLKRLGLDYVDIFYHHRMDPRTPLEETMGALAHVVRQGKALYVGLSNYTPEATRNAAAILQSLGTPCLVHQPRYSMLDRTIEAGLLDTLGQLGIGCAVFSPLAQGLLSAKYLDGIPAEARMTRGGSLKPERLTPALHAALHRLAEVAQERGQTLAQMALAWTLRDPRVTSALIGARTVEQLEDALAARDAPPFIVSQLAVIDAALSELQ
jgi:L-glyceraldehyde 3-phosphate reductase